LAKIRGNDLWVVNSRRRNGLIIHKEFYTEFAGPGAAIGGGLDNLITPMPIEGGFVTLETTSAPASAVPTPAARFCAVPRSDPTSPASCFGAAVTSVIPLPAPAFLMLGGLAVLGVAARRKR